MTWLSNTLITCPSFCLCMTEAEYHERCSELEVPMNKQGDWLDGDDNSLACVHTFITEGAESYIVALKPAPNDDVLTIYARLVHESVHVWQNYCDFIGERNPSKEFEAYSIQAIALALFEHYTANAIKPEQPIALITT